MGRPARPARWSADALEMGTVSSRHRSERASKAGRLARPESMTAVTPVSVMLDSAMEVARMTRRLPGQGPPPQTPQALLSGACQMTFGGRMLCMAADEPRGRSYQRNTARSIARKRTRSQTGCLKRSDMTTFLLNHCLQLMHGDAQRGILPS